MTEQEVCGAAARLVAARADQGFPQHVENPAALTLIANVLRECSVDDTPEREREQRG